MITLFLVMSLRIHASIARKAQPPETRKRSRKVQVQCPRESPGIFRWKMHNGVVPLQHCISSRRRDSKNWRGESSCHSHRLVQRCKWGLFTAD
ncbi:hypothetical protein EI94DRAFT_910046 [Lactarius quietus]|nr:hypothetical protein EI94DRAFT_910046 [Lactarius quietus]